jgi:DNA-binding transcriptional MerR regulator/quercetin dioxygenase-like cupin family protein
MPDPGPLLTIGQAASLVGVSPSSLRNWERLGLVTPARSQGRYRLYSRDVLRQLKRIQSFRRKHGLNLASISYLQQSASATDTPAEVDTSLADLGERLARLRRDQDLTLAAAAAECGISASFIGAVERGQANPSIATLQKLASLYRTNVLSFFGKGPPERRLVRPKDRRILKPQPGVRMELLAFGERLMEPHLFRIAPRASSGGSYRHEGEELLYLLDGKLEIWLDEIERYVLEPGDCLCFASSQAHRWRSLRDRETVALWINTPPTF